MSRSRKERLKLMQSLEYAHLVYLEENRLYILIGMRPRFLLSLMYQEIFLGTDMMSVLKNREFQV